MYLDYGEFADELRKRLRTLIKLRKTSITKVSLAADDSGNALKHFLNSSTKRVNLALFLRWARALDVPYTAIIDSLETNEFSPFDEKYIVDDTNTEEVELRVTSAKNLRFLRASLRKSQAEFAETAQYFTEAGQPDVSMIELFETGQKMIPPMAAIRLAEVYGFKIDDLYGDQQPE